MKKALTILIFIITSIASAQTDTIEVSNGWNLIGALQTGTPSQIISTIPPSIITTSFFGYNPPGGYLGADTLKKGKGYWVKVSQEGKLVMGWVSVPCPGIPTVYYEGKTYNTVQIGSQCWLKENLDVGAMINGSSNASNDGVIEKYCYNSNLGNCTTHGGLYQWNEAMQYVTAPGSQGICPVGWHIPTNAEFQTLNATVSSDGNALKAVGQGTGSGAGTDTSGFSALLAGCRYYLGGFYDMIFEGYFWSSTASTMDAGTMKLDYYSSAIDLYTTYNKQYGFSIRCLKD